MDSRVARLPQEVQSSTSSKKYRKPASIQSSVDIENKQLSDIVQTKIAWDARTVSARRQATADKVSDIIETKLQWDQMTLDHGGASARRGRNVRQNGEDSSCNALPLSVSEEALRWRQSNEQTQTRAAGASTTPGAYAIAGTAGDGDGRGDVEVEIQQDDGDVIMEISEQEEGLVVAELVDEEAEQQQERVIYELEQENADLGREVQHLRNQMENAVVPVAIVEVENDPERKMDVPKQQRRRRRTSIRFMVLFFILSLVVVILILVFVLRSNKTPSPASSASPTSSTSQSPTTNKEVGFTPTCACQPTAYNVKLDFALTCENQTLDGDGFQTADCYVVQSDDPVPLNIFSIEFAEVDSSMNILRRVTDKPDIPYVHGDIVSFTSILDEADILSFVPSGLTIVMTGKNVEGEEIWNSNLMLLANSCEVIPTFQQKQIGWVNFVSGGPPNSNFCNQTLAPTISPSPTFGPTWSLAPTLPQPFPENQPIPVEPGRPGSPISPEPSFEPSTESPVSAPTDSPCDICLGRGELQNPDQEFESQYTQNTETCGDPGVSISATDCLLSYEVYVPNPCICA